MRRHRPGQPLAEATTRVLVVGALAAAVVTLVAVVVLAHVDAPVTTVRDLVGPNTENYVRLHADRMAWTGAGYLVATCGLAVLAAIVVVRRGRHGAGHYADVDVWWKVFDLDARGEGTPYAVVELNDGARVAGRVKTWTSESRGPGRELALVPWRTSVPTHVDGAEVLRRTAPGDPRWDERVIVPEAAIARIHVRFVPEEDEARAVESLLDDWARRTSDDRSKRHLPRLDGTWEDGLKTYENDGTCLVTLHRSDGTCRFWLPRGAAQIPARSVLEAVGGTDRVRYVELRAASMVDGGRWRFRMEEDVLSVLLAESDAARNGDRRL